jgi:hypothetical protein
MILKYYYFIVSLLIFNVYSESHNHLLEQEACIIQVAADNDGNPLSDIMVQNGNYIEPKLFSELLILGNYMDNNQNSKTLTISDVIPSLSKDYLIKLLEYNGVQKDNGNVYLERTIFKEFKRQFKIKYDLAKLVIESKVDNLEASLEEIKNEIIKDTKR